MRQRSEHAGYTWEDNRTRLLIRRRDFFRSLLDLAERHTRVRSMLDVGASYGHLIAIAKERGIETAGVEVVARLRDRIEEELGVPCWTELSDATGAYDLVAFVDSFYYFEQPHEALSEAAALLSDRGVLLFRVTNRNAWIRLVRRFGLERDFRALGDAAVSWSLRGFRRALEPHGLEIRETRFYEWGWRRPLPQRAGAAALAAASTLTAKLWGFAVSPGLTVVAGRPSESEASM